MYVRSGRGNLISVLVGTRVSLLPLSFQLNAEMFSSQALTHASRAGNGGTVRVRTSNAGDLENSVDDTTNTLAGNETSGNGVACDK
jgi:hypothetical protein